MSHAIAKLIILNTNSYDLYYDSWQEFDDYLNSNSTNINNIFEKTLGVKDIIEIVRNFWFNKEFLSFDFHKWDLKNNNFDSNCGYYFKGYTFFKYFSYINYSNFFISDSNIQEFDCKIVPEFKIYTTSLLQSQSQTHQFQILDIYDTIGCLSKYPPIASTISKKWYRSKFLISSNYLFDKLVKFVHLKDYDINEPESTLGTVFELLYPPQDNNNIQTTITIENGLHQFNLNNAINWGWSDGQSNIWHFKKWVLQLFSDLSFYFFNKDEEYILELNRKLISYQSDQKWYENKPNYSFQLAKINQIIEKIEQNIHSYIEWDTILKKEKECTNRNQDNHVDSLSKVCTDNLNSFHNNQEDESLNLNEDSKSYPWGKPGRYIMDKHYSLSIKWKDYESGVIYNNCIFNLYLYKLNDSNKNAFENFTYNAECKHFSISILHDGKIYYNRGSVIGLNPITSIIFYLITRTDEQLKTYCPIAPEDFRRIILQRITMVIDWN